MRHGQTGSNRSGALDTAVPGAVLTDLGIQQARAAAPLLAARGVTATWSSELTRAVQTASEIAEQLGVAPRVSPGLREIGAGELEMRNDPDAVRAYAHCVLSWLGGELDERMPGGEDGHEFLERYDAAVAAVVEDAAAEGHRAVVAVSHGAAIGTWVHGRALGLDRFETARLRNTGIIALDRTEGGWEAVDWVSEPLGGADLDAPDPYAHIR